jgi:hypothetical protein
MKKRWRLLDAITNVRRTAADVVTLCDLVIYGTDAEAEVALEKLPARVRALQFRAQRCLTALEEGQ